MSGLIYGIRSEVIKGMDLLLLYLSGCFFFPFMRPKTCLLTQFLYQNLCNHKYQRSSFTFSAIFLLCYRKQRERLCVCVRLEIKFKSIIQKHLMDTWTHTDVVVVVVLTGGGRVRHGPFQ